MKEFLSKNINTFLLLIIGGLLVLNILSTEVIKTDVKEYRHRIDALQNNIDSTKQVNEIIDNKVEKVDEKVVNLTKEIRYIDKTINVIKNNTDEKVNDVDNFGPNKLELFFSNRYK